MKRSQTQRIKNSVEDLNHDMKGLRNHNSLQGSLDPRRQLSKLSKYTLIYLGCLSVSLCFHDFMQELTRTWCPTCIEARLRTLKIFLPGGIHCNNIWKKLHTSSLDDSVMAFSFFVLDSQLVLRLAVLSHEPEGQVIYTSNGEISGHSWSNFFTLTPCSKSLTHHNHRQGHPDCERAEAKAEITKCDRG